MLELVDLKFLLTTEDDLPFSEAMDPLLNLLSLLLDNSAVANIHFTTHKWYFPLSLEILSKNGITNWRYHFLLHILYPWLSARVLQNY